jgi:hypothetical protein
LLGFFQSALDLVQLCFWRRDALPGFLPKMAGYGCASNPPYGLISGDDERMPVICPTCHFSVAVAMADDAVQKIARPTG